MFVLANGFVHFKVQQMNGGSFLTGYQNLISIRQQRYWCYWIINNPFYLWYWGVSLVNRIYSYTSIWMSGVNDWFNCITSYHLHSLPTTYRVDIWCFLYFPYLYLPIIRTTNAFLLRWRPSYTINLFSVPDKRMQLFSAWSAIDLNRFIRRTCD